MVLMVFILMCVPARVCAYVCCLYVCLIELFLMHVVF